MNSKIINKGTFLALLFSSVQGVQITTSLQAQHQLHTTQGGIFGRMIEQVEAPEMLAEEKKTAKDRKERQLADAEKDYQRMVQVEEQEEAAKTKKEQEEAENAALEAAKRTPQAQMLAAANSAASNISMPDLEATIQAQLQAKLDSGVSKADLLSQMNSGEDALTQTTSSNTLAASATTASTSTQSVIAAVLAKHKHQAAAPAPPVVAAPAPVPRAAAPKVVAAPAPALAQASIEAKASQDKVREMAVKLGVPFTDDLMKLGSNSDISDALIEKAVAAGKTEAQINSAMQSL